MNKLNFKTTIIWIIISLLSLALIISNFAINTQQKNNTNTQKINGYIINKTDIQSIIQNFSTYKKIHNAENGLQNLIEKNIDYNTKIKLSDVAITEKALLNEIINIDIFQKQGVFNPELYHTYLKKTNTTELTFQKKIKVFLEQNSVQHAVKALVDKKSKTKHRQQYLEFKINKADIDEKTEQHALHNTVNRFDVKYTDISIKNITKSINIATQDISASKKRNKNKYKKQTFIKIHHIFIKNTHQKYKNIKNKIKHKHNINKDIQTLNSKILWITQSELNENFKENYINNILLTKTKTGLHIIHRLKTTQNKIYTNNIINTDIINNYKKFKAIKKIHNEIINYKSNSNDITKHFNCNTTALQLKDNYGILSLKLIKPWFFKEKTHITNESNLIKLNNNRYLILKLNINKNTDKNYQSNNHIKSYLNKITIEKNTLQTILKLKNNKKNYPKDTDLKQNKNDFLKRHTHEKISKIIKYKNTYFFLK